MSGLKRVKSNNKQSHCSLNINTTQTLAGGKPFRISLTDPPRICSTAASIEDKKNLQKKETIEGLYCHYISHKKVLEGFC